ncbi:MAG: hypothetical protein ABGY42_11305 [bacterium]
MDFGIAENRGRDADSGGSRFNGTAQIIWWMNVVALGMYAGALVFLMPVGEVDSHRGLLPALAVVGLGFWQPCFFAGAEAKAAPVYLWSACY